MELLIFIVYTWFAEKGTPVLEKFNIVDWGMVCPAALTPLGNPVIVNVSAAPSRLYVIEFIFVLIQTEVAPICKFELAAEVKVKVGGWGTWII